MADNKDDRGLERQLGVKVPPREGREECSYQAPARKPDEGSGQNKPDPKPQR